MRANGLRLLMQLLYLADLECLSPSGACFFRERTMNTATSGLGSRGYAKTS